MQNVADITLGRHSLDIRIGYRVLRGDQNDIANQGRPWKQVGRGANPAETLSEIPYRSDAPVLAIQIIESGFHYAAGNGASNPRE